MNWTTNQRESIELGLQAANRALELDPELSRAYFAKGALLLAARQHREAEAVMERVVEMDPNYAEGRAQQAFILMNSGKHERALDAIARAKQLNPLYSALYMYVEAMALFHLERYEEAAALLEVAVVRNPAFDRMQLMYAASLAYLGDIEKAQWSVEEAKIQSPQLSIADEQENSVLLVQSDLDRYLNGLRLAGLE